MDENNVASLLKQIEEAFAGVQYPGDDNLVSEGSLNSPDGQYLLKSLRGRERDSFSVKELRHHAEDVFLMTPEAFRYYLPAYMTASVREFEEADIIPENLVFALTPRVGDDSLTEYKRARVAALDGAQRRAVASFLKYVAGNWDSDGAEKLEPLIHHYQQ